MLTWDLTPEKLDVINFTDLELGKQKGNYLGFFLAP